MNDTQIGTMVKLIRTLNGMSQKALANEVNLDAAYICRFERGMRLKEVHIRKIEAALSVSFQEVAPLFDAFAAAVSGTNNDPTPPAVADGQPVAER